MVIVLVSPPYNNFSQEIYEDCGLNDNGYTIHTLRHTYATLILKNGGNLMEIKDLLGHVDLNSTLYIPSYNC